MNHPKTAQVTKYCGLFLILLIFLPFDLAVTVTVSFYLALNSRNYAKLVIVSLVIFLADIIFRNFDISIRFISDLALDSYILLLSSLFIYLKSQQRVIEYFQKLGSSSRKVFSLNTLMMIGISSIFSLLLAPIVGIPFAVISGYISFSYLSKHFEGKYAYMAGLFFLFFSPFFIIAKRDDISESFAIISFYFLIIGTIQEIISHIQVHKGELAAKIKKSESFAFSLPKINFEASKRLRPTMKFIIIAGITTLLSFAVTFFGIRNKLTINSINTIITSKSQKITPVITTIPSVTPIIPTPTIDVAVELSTISAQLKVMVENGTEIYGLAASTAARLKNAGFKNVDTGNATRNDYKNWEITPKKDDPVSINYIKKVLKLETLTVNKASESAKFDLLIITGSKLL